MKLQPNELVNLEKFITYLPKDGFVSNTVYEFYYSREKATVVARNHSTYFQIRVNGDLGKSPNAATSIKCILNNTVGKTDAEELYSALLEYNSTYFANSDVVSKWLDYRKLRVEIMNIDLIIMV